MHTQRLPFAGTVGTPPRRVRHGDIFTRGGVTLHHDFAERHYHTWAQPTCIIADGPYGVSGFPGDARSHRTLAEWYRPHITEWARLSTPATSLWFWNTEVGWATVHPVLDELGWEYRCCNIWDKGMSHVAGNANTQTLRMFPVVTEVCVLYVRRAEFRINGQRASMQEWLRHEWARTGLPFKLANEACGVQNAATRKYLTPDHLWYFPPPDAFEKLVQYANKYGSSNGRPYFSTDGRAPMTAELWSRQRSKFKCEFGVTNVWRVPQVSGAARIQGTRDGMRYKFRSLHGSQKPLALIDLAVRSSTERGDTVWEPFGGLAPAAVTSLALERRCFAAEILPEFYRAAVERLQSL